MESVWNFVNRDIADILSGFNRIAVVGLSDNPARPSFGVAAYMKNHGYSIIPVNPGHSVIMGLTSYPNLEAIGQPVDIVNIFRRSAEVPPIVDQAIKIGAKVVWMQSGIIHEESARKALDAGLKVVMDACIKMEHAMHLG